MSDLKELISDNLTQRFGTKFDIPDTDGLDSLASLSGHSTCRDFLERSVDPILLKLICSCGLSAPSKSDLQQGEILIVENPALRKEIGDLIPTMPWITQAPVFLIVLANGQRLREISELHNTEFANDHLDAFFNASFDAGILLNQLIVSADAVGLRTCPISAIRNHASHISEILSLPELVFPTVGLCMGWPAVKDKISARLPLDLTVHHDQFDSTNGEELVIGYDHRRGKLEGFDATDPGFRGWSKQKADMYSEIQRNNFGEFVRRKKFNLD